MNKQILFMVGCFAVLFTFNSCKEEIKGCTDSTSSNFNPDATVDDGSCNGSNGTGTGDYPAGYSKADYTELFHKVYGGSGNNDDELTSGMVTDASGNTYFSLNTNNAAANNNILIGKISSSGNLEWAKEWDGNYDDISPDSGENGETGGTANSISIDASGNIYVVGKNASVSQNNINSILILKINPSDGSILWEKIWKHEWPAAGGSHLARMNAEGYGIDASGDYVYVTGANGQNMIPLVALNKSTGAMFFEMTIDIVAGTKDRGYVLKADGSGNVFIGGVTGSYAHLTKVSGANTATPSLAWVKQVEIGYGSRINGIDIDGTDVYLSCDRRGATTYFSLVKMNSDGVVQWGQTFPGTNGDRNNIHCVKVIGNSVYAGGRTGQQSLDTQLGDGLFTKLSKADGSLEWSAIYFTGTNSAEVAEHRIKGISVVGSDVYIVGQVYGGNGNYDKFYGDWITKSVTLESYSPSVTDLTASGTTDPADGEVRDAVGTYSDANSSYVLQDATSKTTAKAPDGDLFISKMNLK
ncbi:MAG: hypothetical protein GY810_18150 [Aureispira sp.]|nr:hypothetical protein [Aureispira sp.]